jgi:hypothetical protein
MVVLVPMYALPSGSSRSYEWGRLLLVAVTALTVAAASLLPTEGLAGLASRTALWLPAGLPLATGFTMAEPAPVAIPVRGPGGWKALAGQPNRARERACAGYAPEVYEAVRRDED